MLLLFLWTFILKDAYCLKIRRLEVPPAIPMGASVLLQCDFDLESDTLYSVKWYKNYVEFFRYLPIDGKESLQDFKFSGVYVELSLSNISYVFLSKTDLNSEGTYACEVSAETPSFTTIRAEQQMKIYILPQGDLFLENITNQDLVNYRIGDIIDLTCALGLSKPKPELFWFINNQKVKSNQLIKYPTVVQKSSSLDTRLLKNRLGLKFKLKQDHFKSGVLNLKCTASLTLAYKFESIHYINNEISSNQTHYSSNSSLTIQSEADAPIITGGLLNYQVGDLVQLNCSTTSLDSTLDWFINDEVINSTQLVINSGQKTLKLNLKIKKSHLQLAELKLKCRAIILRTIANFERKILVELKKNSKLNKSIPKSEMINSSLKAVQSGVFFILLLSAHFF